MVHVRHGCALLLLGHVLVACASAPPGAERAGPPATQVVIVRHAEKGADDANDPDLSEAGHRRAHALLAAIRAAGVTSPVAALYATPYRRTRQTLTPAASELTLPVTVVDADAAALAHAIRTQHAGEVVVVVGHSNTVPKLIAALGGPPLPDLAVDAFGDLFVLTLHGPRAELTHRRFGD
jgi:2,3-bisphosphoglycerate-dependent phosphoglycerate mutase